MSTCRCGHDTDLHDLEDIALVDNPNDPRGSRLKWRFQCRGVYGTAFYPMQCTCNNIELREEASDGEARS